MESRRESWRLPTDQIYHGEAIRDLHALGLKVVMLTGDNRTPAAGGQASAWMRWKRRSNRRKSPLMSKKLAGGRETCCDGGDGHQRRTALSEAEVGIAMALARCGHAQRGITLVKATLAALPRPSVSVVPPCEHRQNWVSPFLYNTLAFPWRRGALPFFAALIRSSPAANESEFPSRHSPTLGLRTVRCEWSRNIRHKHRRLTSDLLHTMTA